MGKRFIGIDLHRNQFTCCVRLPNERTYLSEWKLEELAKFVKKLRPADEVAVEITGNTRLFYDAVAPACGPGRGRRYEPVPSHQSIGEENRPSRCPAAGVVFEQGSAAGSANEG